METRYVLSKKKNPGDTVNRFKARLVVKGYRQKYGVDYHETFSPVIRFDILRTTLALAAVHGWNINTIDFTQAYLNATLQEDLWVTLPDMSVKKLKRALYGLKQAGIQWNRTYADAIMQREHWKCSNYDDCLFYAISPRDKRIAILWVYVDDSAQTGDWEEETQNMKEHLLQKFPGKDLGSIQNYQGMEVERKHEGGIFIHQREYTRKVVREFLGEVARPARMPMEKGTDLSPKKKNEEPLDMIKYPYRRALGQILYIANTTHPDLSNAARELGAASCAPTMRHWRSLQHVLRYMHTNPEYGLVFPKTPTKVNTLKGFSDADFAGNEESRKSCTGYVIKLRSAIIAWVSRVQRTVATSTTEAEWNALYEGVRHGEFIRKFLQEISFTFNMVQWYCDNLATVTAATVPGHTGRTRYLDVKLKKTREMALQGLLSVMYVPTSEQEADGLTKRLTKTTHIKFCDFLLSK